MSPMEQYVIGIDVGGTNIKAGAVDYQGNIIASLRVLSEASSGPEAILSKLESIVRDLQLKVKDRNPRSNRIWHPGSHSFD